jgi:hypothetical protein
LTVRTACTDESGTVLAVVARNGPTFDLISVDSVRLAPGSHDIRARLLGPGKIQIVEPGDAVMDTRALPELIAAVPRSLNLAGPARLICAVETTGPASRVAARLYQVEKFIGVIDSQFPEPGSLKIGLVGYGAHRFEKGQDDDRVVVAWDSAQRDAITSLGQFGAAKPSENRAAQVEDALAEIERRLDTERNARSTALIIFGDGQPYPAQGSDTIPACPKGHDWYSLVSALRTRGCKPAVVRDNPSAHGSKTWLRLGSGTVYPLDKFDADLIGRRLGLLVPSLEHMPFPLSVPGKE